MTRVSVSILDADFLHLGDELRAVERAGADSLHLDVMDGHFVPSISFGLPVARAVRRATRLPVRTHLMVREPERFIEEFAPHSDLITFHIEACPDPTRLITRVTDSGTAAGVSLNPDTPVERLRDIITAVSDVLVMSVFPGRGGQSFIPESLERIRTVRSMVRDASARATVSVDGGIRLDNCGPVVEAGADTLISGSAVFAGEDYAATIRALRCSNS
jgi:ribulose-phosphate 3-epimerase